MAKKKAAAKKKTASKKPNRSKAKTKPRESSRSPGQRGAPKGGSDELPATEAELLNQLRSMVVTLGVYESDAEKKRLAHLEAKHKVDELRGDVIQLLRKTSGVPEPVESSSSPDGWKTQPLEEVLGKRYTNVIVKALGKQLERPDLGCLQGWLKRHKLTDIPGIGATAAGAIIDKFEAFFKAHPEWKVI